MNVHDFAPRRPFKRYQISSVKMPPTPVAVRRDSPFLSAGDNIVKLATVATRLGQSRAWVKEQALQGTMPHFAVPRKNSTLRLTFPWDQVLSWHAREFGRNLLSGDRVIREIAAA